MSELLSIFQKKTFKKNTLSLSVKIFVLSIVLSGSSMRIKTPRGRFGAGGASERFYRMTILEKLYSFLRNNYSHTLGSKKPNSL